MCFSPEADLCTGVVVSVIGIDALCHVKSPRQIVLAATPLLLGLHEIDEAFVWWGLRGQVSWPVTHAAIYVFLAFAFALPFLVPLAMVGIEPVIRRRRMMTALLAVGALTTVTLLIAVIRGPVGASIDGSHIAYTANVSYGNLLVALYILATCGSLLLASTRLFFILGVVNLGVVIALAWITFTGFTSLWCAFAAITSFTVAIYLRRSNRPLAPAVA
jgi:Family of unknown function (DUF6629)